MVSTLVAGQVPPGPFLFHLPAAEIATSTTTTTENQQEVTTTEKGPVENIEKFLRLEIAEPVVEPVIEAIEAKNASVEVIDSILEEEEGSGALALEEEPQTLWESFSPQPEQPTTTTVSVSEPMTTTVETTTFVKEEEETTQRPPGYCVCMPCETELLQATQTIKVKNKYFLKFHYL